MTLTIVAPSVMSEMPVAEGVGVGEGQKKVVLAYSGGLDTSIILKWLANKGFQVICFCANVGQEGANFDEVQEKAMKVGAAKVYVCDLRREFVLDAVWPAVQANAIYENRYMLGTSLARPIIAKKLVEIARQEGAQFLAHGATGKGNDQVRFELSALALEPTLQIIAPWRDSEFLAVRRESLHKDKDAFKGRADLLQYAADQGIPVDATPKAPYSVDDNLYHISYESGMLEDPMTGPMKEMFRMTVDPQDAPDKPERICITFEEGLPVKVQNLEDGEVIEDPLDLFLYLNKVGGKHGVGRIDIVESRFIGMKSRGVYETPGGTVLRAAHLDLETMCLDRHVLEVRDMMSAKFAEYCYNGLWYAPEMELVMNTVKLSQKHVKGEVFLTLYKGNVTVNGRRSPLSLYDEELASMDIDVGSSVVNFDPVDAQGFIRINALRLKLAGVQKKKAASII